MGGTSEIGLVVSAGLEPSSRWMNVISWSSMKFIKDCDGCSAAKYITTWECMHAPFIQSLHGPHASGSLQIELFEEGEVQLGWVSTSIQVLLRGDTGASTSDGTHLSHCLAVALGIMEEKGGTEEASSTQPKLKGGIN